jgi:RNA polymerase sigma-70 factor (ECF subfamily)
LRKANDTLANTPDPDELVEQFYDDLFRFLRHLTRHTQEAEDLAQATLVRAVKNLKSYDGRASVRTWLHAIAYREFLNWRRGRRLLLALDPRSPQRELGFEQVQDKEVLLQALERLGPKLSATFLLVEVQELSHAQAAEALQVPVGTVKSRLHEARTRLQRLLSDESGEPIPCNQSI